MLILYKGCDVLCKSILDNMEFKSLASLYMDVQLRESLYRNFRISLDWSFMWSRQGLLQTFGILNTALYGKPEEFVQSLAGGVLIV